MSNVLVFLPEESHNSFLEFWSVPPDRTDGTWSNVPFQLKFSTGFRSGLCDGDSETLTLLSSFVFKLQLPGWCLAVLICLHHVLSSSSPLFCEVHQSLLQQKHPHIMMLPPPYFTVVRMFLDSQAPLFFPPNVTMVITVKQFKFWFHQTTKHDSRNESLRPPRSDVVNQPLRRSQRNPQLHKGMHGSDHLSTLCRWHQWPCPESLERFTGKSICFSQETPLNFSVSASF